MRVRDQKESDQKAKLRMLVSGELHKIILEYQDEELETALPKVVSDLLCFLDEKKLLRWRKP